MEEAIVKGMKWKEKEGKKWHANMSGIECVFIKKEDLILVITVYEAGVEK